MHHHTVCSVSLVVCVSDTVAEQLSRDLTMYLLLAPSAYCLVLLVAGREYRCVLRLCSCNASQQYQIYLDSTVMQGWPPWSQHLQQGEALLRGVYGCSVWSEDLS